MLKFLQFFKKCKIVNLNALVVVKLRKSSSQKGLNFKESQNWAGVFSFSNICVQCRDRNETVNECFFSKRNYQGVKAGVCLEQDAESKS